MDSCSGIPVIPDQWIFNVAIRSAAAKSTPVQAKSLSPAPLRHCPQFQCLTSPCRLLKCINIYKYFVIEPTRDDSYSLSKAQFHVEIMKFSELWNVRPGFMNTSLNDQREHSWNSQPSVVQQARFHINLPPHDSWLKFSRQVSEKKKADCYAVEAERLMDEKRLRQPG